MQLDYILNVLYKYKQFLQLDNKNNPKISLF